jgi:hypothetical protein
MKFRFAQLRANLGSNITTGQSVCQGGFHTIEAEFGREFFRIDTVEEVEVDP